MTRVDSRLRHIADPNLVGAAANTTNFTIWWANCEADVRAAQRLRYQVFVTEMGATLQDTGLHNGEYMERDRFDAFCDHLLICAPSPSGETKGTVIGTCRVLRPEQARRAGGFYCDTEFDLSPLQQLREGTVELGRSCVHPDWRSGGVVMAMWRALGQYMSSHQLSTLMGCASVWLSDNGALALSVWEQLRQTHLVEARWRVAPRNPLLLPDGNHIPILGERHAVEKVGASNATAQSLLRLPALIKGYVRCGARLLGPPARDLAFNTADLPMMMHFDDITPRYRQHFLEERTRE